jgi:hypothetical protein
MQKTLILTLEDHVLIGKYSADHEHILIIIDSSKGIPYTITLPDLMSPIAKEFMFKNIPHGNSGASITIATSNNQLIDYRDRYHIVAPYNFSSFRTDLKGSWILLGFDTH